MTGHAITDKADMYRRLAAGEFGNTVPAFMGLPAWQARGPRWDCPLWGVRSMRSGDRRARLDVPTADVAAFCRDTFGADGFNVSPMVDQWLTFRANVFDSPAGLVVQGVVGRRDLKWRPALERHSREMTGSAAATALRHFLNANSHDDLMILLEQYPGHVVELTALDRCYGTAPHRNAVVWEVRDGLSGRYERDAWQV